ncbi:hypothetical protein ACFHW2_25535 [Actinomadura sp. LOL_016]|uniref:hypothetical protein n=1 Tax=unclassified Actinomadura TaxID=2626254 RepID=UPI003A81082B
MEPPQQADPVQVARPHGGAGEHQLGNQAVPEREQQPGGRGDQAPRHQQVTGGHGPERLGERERLRDHQGQRPHPRAAVGGLVVSRDPGHDDVGALDIELEPGRGRPERVRVEAVQVVQPRRRHGVPGREHRVAGAPPHAEWVVPVSAEIGMACEVECAVGRNVPRHEVQETEPILAGISFGGADHRSRHFDISRGDQYIGRIGRALALRRERAQSAQPGPQPPGVGGHAGGDDRHNDHVEALSVQPGKTPHKGVPV